VVKSFRSALFASVIIGSLPWAEEKGERKDARKKEHGVWESIWLW
jgi:hypothetical protein